MNQEQHISESVAEETREAVLEQKMQGCPLSSLGEDLSLIPEGAEPFDTVPSVRERLVGIPPYLEKEKDVKEIVRKLPLSCFSDFSKEELCRMWLSDMVMWNRDFKELSEIDPFFKLMERISLSLRHGEGRLTGKNWNAIVRIYNGIKNFNAGEGTETAYDTAPRSLTFGRSADTNIFLDGELALLVHEKEKHVLTLGFSVGAEPGIFIAQVQSPIKKGNRFLFKLGDNPVNGAIDLMKKNFPGFEIYIIDPEYLSDHLREVSALSPEHIAEIPFEKIQKNYGGVLGRCDNERKFTGMKYHHVKNEPKQENLPE